ncbi:iron-sulfur cluster assembly scaffold protein [Desulfobacterales bacterium HSG16]|nr:iron-sulfur cluster assembly scaffold protein [Desulfobacterales bacterium HSG16]
MQKEEFDFWQEHSLTFLEMAFTTDRQEKMAGPDGHGKKTGDCGDTVEFFVILDNDRIKTMSYMLDGCMHTNACANTIIKMAEGKSLNQVWEITPETVADYLQTLPEDHFHCAELAVGALYLALSDCRENSNMPWKKLYK